MELKKYPLRAVMLAMLVSCYPLSSFSQILAHNHPQQSPQERAQVIKLKDALLKLKVDFQVDILFEEKIVSGIVIETRQTDSRVSFEQNLKNLLRTTGLRYKKIKKDSYMILAPKAEKKATASAASPEETYPALTESPTNTPEPPAQSPTAVSVAQTISGKVTDENSSALPGVSVSVKSTTTGTATDANGNYSVTVPDVNSVLVFSAIGYLTKEETVGSRTTINLQMAPDVKSLSEVVVIGYGTVKKSDLTASVASVKSEDIKAFPVQSVDQALSARATGINVTQASGAPGGAVTVRVRGPNSINSGSEPLYVVDGIPIYSDNDAYSAGGNRTSSNALATINPGDIESVEILKDASGTAIYGSRGANGVVLITTKRGKAGATRIDYEGSQSVQTIAKRIDMLNATEYAQYQNQRAASRGQTAPYPTPEQFGEGVNWLDETSRTGTIANHQLTFSGGSEKTQFAIIGGYFRNDGIIKNTNFDRFSLRVNLDSKFFNDKVKLGTSSMISRTTQSAIPTDRGGPGGSIITILGQSPIGPVYNPDGTYHLEPYDGRFLTNPLAEVQEVIDKDRGIRFLGNTYLQVELAKDLYFKTSFGVDIVSNYRETYYSDRTRIGRDQAANLRAYELGNRNIVNYLNENTLSYSKTFNQHRIDAVVGYTYQIDNNRYAGSAVRGFVLNDFAQNNIQNGNPTTRQVTSDRNGWGLNSVLGRLNYSLLDRYLVTVTFRRDGSSRFAPSNRWANFPSLALGWKIQEESFMSSLPFVSTAKLRASYGLTGNSNIALYQSIGSLNVQNYLIGDAAAPAIFQNRIANPNLKWESTAMFDVGLDLGFFNNRLNITADYFRNQTSDLLLFVQLPPTTGFGQVLKNSGSLRNTGFELSANWLAIDKGDLRWDMTANISTVKNEITDLGGTPPFFSYDGSHLGNQGSYVTVGKPIGGWYGYDYIGIWQNADEIANNPSIDGIDKPGYPRYRDVNNDGIVNTGDRTYLGDPNPRLIWGFNTTVKFKRFDLNVFVRGAEGQKIRNLQASEHADGVGNYNQYRTVLENSWTPDNPGATRPIVDATREFAVFFRRSNFFIEDGSFIRLQNVSLGFTLPSIKYLRNARVYVSGQNLFLITKYTGWDPEVSNSGQNNLNRGDDYDTYPRPRTITFGMQVGI